MFENISPEQLALVGHAAKVRPYSGPSGRRGQNGDQIIFYAGKQGFSRPGSYCFDEFLVDHLKYTFGKQWGRSEAKLPKSKQHSVLQWMGDLFDSQRSVLGSNHDPRIVVSIKPSGSAMAIISLADDLYRLRLVDRLPESLVSRLRKRTSFQGARYEVALAASFVRSGFQIDWLDDENISHAEFTASLPLTNDCIVVEAKSRHRDGVLHQQGERAEFEKMTAGVHTLYRRALEKPTGGNPIMICIDVNLPLAIKNRDSREKWIPEIQQFHNSLVQSSAATPSKEFCLAFTNFGWHFANAEIAPAHQTLYSFPRYTEAVPQDLEIFAAVIQALDNYGQRPEVLRGY